MNFTHSSLNLARLEVSDKNLDLFLQLLQFPNQQVRAQVLGCYGEIHLAITKCCFDN